MMLQSLNRHFCVTSVISTRSEKSLHNIRLSPQFTQRFLASRRNDGSIIILTLTQLDKIDHDFDLHN